MAHDCQNSTKGTFGLLQLGGSHTDIENFVDVSTIRATQT